MSFTKLQWGFAHQMSVDMTVTYSADPYRPRQRVRRHVRPAGPLPTVAEITDPDFLLTTYYDLKARGGPAAGPDRTTYPDLGRAEAARLMRQLSEYVRSGEYRHGPTRPVQIPKLRGGHRTLRIANLTDRVLSAALNTLMVPFWERVFLPRSMGFRPARGPWLLLAELERTMIDQNRWVIAVDDVRKAFDTVAIADALADHEAYIADTSLLALIRAVLQGSDGPRRERGIDQGAAYSPTTLNARLHRTLDVGVERRHLPPWRRFADNLAFVCRSVTEGEKAIQCCRELLDPAGLTLKGEDGRPADLNRGSRAHLMGYTLFRTGSGLGLVPGPDAWRKLEANLLRAHRSAHPPLTASQAVLGWVHYAGPTFESQRGVTLERLRQTTTRYGYQETNLDLVLREWEESWEQWQRLRERVRTRARDIVVPAS
ncbi:MAG: ltrA 3 [Gemmataceae bacterium]|nr:ltrA 3 [Gemmataceae bacterium]